MPAGDADFAKRWALIKRFVTERCGARLHRDEWMNRSRQARHESTLWQRRYWEHLIRDESDLNRHRDYVHWNPVKHGHVPKVAEWPHSTFHRFVRQGLYPADWGGMKEPVDGTSFGE